MSKLTNLKKLMISGTRITTLPEWIGNFSKLDELVIANNPCTSLPESLGNLVNLTSINLSANLITSLPKSIGKLVNLHTIELHPSMLRTIPATISNLNKISLIRLEDSPILAHGENDEQWGRSELLQHFGRRVYFTEAQQERTPANTTLDDVQSPLAKQPIHKLPKNLVPPAFKDVVNPYGFDNILVEDNVLSFYPMNNCDHILKDFMQIYRKKLQEQDVRYFCLSDFMGEHKKLHHPAGTNKDHFHLRFDVPVNNAHVAILTASLLEYKTQWTNDHKLMFAKGIEEEFGK